MKQSSVLWLGGVLVLLGLMAVCEAHCGPNPPPPAVQQAPFVEPPAAPGTVPPGIPPTYLPMSPTPPSPSHADSIDDLLNRLDTIEKQEVELKKAKEETVAKLKNKVEQLKQRIQKVGVSVEPFKWTDSMGIGIRY